MSVSRSWPEQQILDGLAEKIEAGVVTIDESSTPYYQNLATTWPWVEGFLLDWRAVPGCRYLEAPSRRRPDGSFTVEEQGPELRQFWQQARHELGIGDEDRLCVVGDSFDVGFAILLPASALADHLVDIFEINMHWYVYPEDLSWCFHYKLQGDAYYGRLPGRGTSGEAS